MIDDESGFDSLPVLHCWPADGGRFFTLPVVCTVDPETGAQNWGMYRMQVYDDRSCGMHWHLHKDGAHFFQKYRERGQRMPVAVALGSDPAVTYASTAPLPEGIWEAMFAGFLRGRSAEVAKATLLFPARPVPRLPPRAHNAPRKSGVPGHHRRHSAQGGLLHGQGH